MAHNVNHLFEDLLWLLKVSGEVDDSRNGPVRTIQEPTLFKMVNPDQRVLFHPDRKANPYFHVMETVWMLAGAQSVDFLLPFNGNMQSYAEDNNLIHGAYGYRWRNHFDRDQIKWAIDRLRKDPYNRQTVIAMWDGSVDLYEAPRDRPCNTQLIFRTIDGKLNMTVTNRSNDLVWGACGANAVHMTYLHELIARAVGLKLGTYYVVSTNLHIYERHWGLMDKPSNWDRYGGEIKPFPILWDEEDYTRLLLECEQFVKHGPEYTYTCKWIKHVVVPMYEHYACRLNGDKVTYDTAETMAKDWALAEEFWREWND